MVPNELHQSLHPNQALHPHLHKCVVAGREGAREGGSKGGSKEASKTFRWLGVSGPWEGEGAREQGKKQARPSGG